LHIYRAKYNKWGICTLEGFKKHAGPSPETENETPWIVIPKIKINEDIVCK
jgi:hypothetical protein